MTSHEEESQRVENETSILSPELPETKNQRGSDENARNKRDAVMVLVGIFLGFILAAAIFGENKEEAPELRVGHRYTPYHPGRTKEPYVHVWDGHRRYPTSYKAQYPIPSTSFQVIEVDGKIIYYPIPPEETED